MRVTFPNTRELSGDWAKGKQQLQQDLDKAGKAINSSWATEHAVDGSHGDVTADSVSVQGAVMGEWFDLPFNAGRFFADGSAVWEVASSHVNYLKAMRIGQLVFVIFRVENTELSVDTSDALYIRMPEFHAIATAGTQVSLQTWFGGNNEWSDVANATNGIGTVNTQAQPFDPSPTTLLALNRIDPAAATFGTWAISDDLSIGGSIWFPVNPDNLPLPYSFV